MWPELYATVEDDEPKPRDAYIERASAINQDGTINTHILGFVHVARNVAAQEGDEKTLSMFAADTVVIDDQTIDAIVEDAGLGKDYLKTVEAELQSTLPIRAKLDYFDSMKTLQKYLAENVPTGMGLREFIDQVGKDEVMKALGISAENPHYIETVYRTNYGAAHSAGRWASTQASPLIKMIEYQTVMDNRTTPICQELDGVILPKDDPFWDSHYPLNHFNCRSTVSELTEAYIDIEGIEPSAPPKIGDDLIHEGFNENPAKTGDWMKPSKGMKERLAEYER